ncbi:MAG: tRNA 4-thiouridine(8) synthase ThiI [Lachnospiraceae bacterium]|jgi:thiamine biosynthesis protein ThiI|nr:tRNA 4-thiouridine(8) synthase ThiI [Lachnospiraceae bacterium]
MFHAFLVKYGEIGVKGKNRYVFEDALIARIKHVLYPVEGTFQVTKDQGRVYVEAVGAFDYEETVAALQRVFGVVGICPVVKIPNQDIEGLQKEVLSYMHQMYENATKSFKVHTRRVNKRYALNSMEVSAAIGEKILQEFPGLRVDVHEPELILHIELRNYICIYSEILPGPGGMPLGTNGRSMLLLSGGIDSPVAGYMVAKRGVCIDAVYFHAPPYTSERAKQKVVDLAKKVARYTGAIRLHVINFAEIQMYIYDTCPHDELTILMRRYMMRIAEKIAMDTGCLALITGESIGQVASQTVQSIAATNDVCTLPVFRPLIAFDKEDIVTIAKKIDTYETSILPYEDCCTTFVAKHPVTKPRVDVIRRSEEALMGQIEEMVERALAEDEVIEIR